MGQGWGGPNGDDKGNARVYRYRMPGNGEVMRDWQGLSDEDRAQLKKDMEQMRKDLARMRKEMRERRERDGDDEHGDVKKHDRDDDHHESGDDDDDDGN